LLYVKKLYKISSYHLNISLIIIWQLHLTFMNILSKEHKRKVHVFNFEFLTLSWYTFTNGDNLFLFVCCCCCILWHLLVLCIVLFKSRWVSPTHVKLTIACDMMIALSVMYFLLLLCIHYVIFLLFRVVCLKNINNQTS
jgi:hypothetical protein